MCNHSFSKIPVSLSHPSQWHRSSIQARIPTSNIQPTQPTLTDKQKHLFTHNGKYFPFYILHIGLIVIMCSANKINIWPSLSTSKRIQVGILGAHCWFSWLTTVDHQIRVLRGDFRIRRTNRDSFITDNFMATIWKTPKLAGPDVLSKVKIIHKINPNSNSLWLLALSIPIWWYFSSSHSHVVDNWYWFPFCVDQLQHFHHKTFLIVPWQTLVQTTISSIKPVTGESLVDC